MREIIYSEPARQALKTGVDALANAVKTTLGPRGRNVVIDRGYGAPVITKDGVTVAREVKAKGHFENIGANIVREAASKTNDAAGDGTTTATVLAQAIIQEGLKNVTAGANPLDIRRGIEFAVEVVVKYLQTNVAKPVDDEGIKRVAAISANDRQLGEKIAEAMLKIGRQGAITVDESQGPDVKIDIVQGMRIPKGYVNQNMVTNPERLEANYQDVHVLVTDKRLQLVTELIPFIERLMQENIRELVIVCDQIEGEALTMLVMNTIKGIFKTVVVPAPGYGEKKRGMLNDLAVLVGATIVSDETGMTFDKAGKEVLGHVDRAIVTSEHSTFVGGKGKKDDIDVRVAQLNLQLENTEMEFDREQLRDRIAKLTSGIALIRAGGATEVEMRERKHRIDDAVNATKAAIEEGIVPGGGVALLKARKILNGIALPTFRTDVKTGIDIVYRALVSPIRTIAENAGVDGSVIIRDIELQSTDSMGWDAENDRMVDMLEVGIIDPMKVTRCALQNAASAAALFLTTECVICEVPDSTKSE